LFPVLTQNVKVPEDGQIKLPRIRVSSAGCASLLRVRCIQIAVSSPFLFGRLHRLRTWYIVDVIRQARSKRWDKHFLPDNRHPVYENIDIWGNTTNLLYITTGTSLFT